MNKGMNTRQRDWSEEFLGQREDLERASTNVGNSFMGGMIVLLGG
ncbi:hypothetical protein [Arthrobacter rhizosphaerae]|nr:hypothetical protein [Arthrobacter rhizosphaerae]